mgnify:CR=1 FL=1
MKWKPSKRIQIYITSSTYRYLSWIRVYVWLPYAFICSTVGASKSHPSTPSDYCGFVSGLAILRLYRFLALSLWNYSWLPVAHDGHLGQLLCLPTAWRVLPLYHHCMRASFDTLCTRVRKLCTLLCRWCLHLCAHWTCHQASQLLFVLLWVALVLKLLVEILFSLLLMRGESS